jgi:hypothetical protein
MLTLVGRYRLQVPYQDEWHLVPVMARLFAGQLTWHDLWALHNEHRLLFPKLIMVTLARCTRWNLDYELVLALLLGGALFALVTWRMLHSLRQYDGHIHLWLIPLNACLLFSLKQRENWLWGWQLTFFLCPLAVLAGIFVLTRSTLCWRNAALAALLGTFASYTHGAGLFIWPVGAALLLVIESPHPTLRRRALAAWCLAAALVMALYFIGYEKPAADAAPHYFLQYPMRYVSFMLTMLGQPLAGTRAAQLGYFGLLVNVATLLLLWCRTRVPHSLLLPFVGMVLWVLIQILVIAAGRVSYGAEAAAVSRYTTFTLPFWSATLYLLVLLHQAQRAEPNPRLARLLRFATRFATAIIIIMSLKASLDTLPSYREFHAELAPAQQALLAGRDDRPLLDKLYPNGYITYEYGKILRRNRLTLFRLPQYQAPPPAPPK